MKRLNAISFASAILLSQVALATTTRDDITSILDLTRVLTPYRQTNWQFCEPGTYVSTIDIATSKTPSSIDSKTIRSIQFECTSPDEKLLSYFLLPSDSSLPGYDIDSDFDIESCPRNVFPNKSQSHVKAVFPGIGSFVKGSYTYTSGYSALQMTCDDTSKNNLTLQVQNGGKIEWRDGYSCDSGAICGAALFIGESTDKYDSAISGMSFACCKKPN